MDPAYEALHQRGATLRAQVLGEDWVQGHATNSQSFGAGYQDVASALAWGGIWCREGLSLRDRSMLTVGVLAALGREQELRGHIHGALRNGVTTEELEELFIHIGLYAGFPMAVAANRIAQSIFTTDSDGDEDA